MNPEKIILAFAMVGMCIATARLKVWVTNAGVEKIKSDYLRQFIRRDVIGFFAPAIALCRSANKRSWNYVRQMRVIYRYTCFFRNR